MLQANGVARRLITKLVTTHKDYKKKVFNNNGELYNKATRRNIKNYKYKGIWVMKIIILL